jgi:hypothetical protein
VLQWLRTNGCPWDEHTCYWAAKGDAETSRYAAKGGHLKALRWARENGCPWDENGLLFIAAQNGHKAVVRALIKAGADVNKAMDNGWTPLLIAAQNGHQAVVRALIELGANEG